MRYHSDDDSAYIEMCERNWREETEVEQYHNAILECFNGILRYLESDSNKDILDVQIEKNKRNSEWYFVVSTRTNEESFGTYQDELDAYIAAIEYLKIVDDVAEVMKKQKLCTDEFLQDVFYPCKKEKMRKFFWNLHDSTMNLLKNN